MVELDKKVKGVLDNMESSVSPELWGKIESQLPLKNNNKKWIGFFVLFIITSVVLTYMLTKDTTKNNNQQELIQEIQNLTLAESTNYKNSNRIGSKNEISLLKNTNLSNTLDEHEKTISMSKAGFSKTNDNSLKINKSIVEDINLVQTKTKAKNIESSSETNKKSKSKTNRSTDVTNDQDYIYDNTSVKSIEDSNPILKQESDSTTEYKGFDFLNENGGMVHQTNNHSRLLKSVNPLAKLDKGILKNEVLKLDFFDILRDPECPNMLEEEDEHFFFEAHVSPIFDQYSLKSRSDEFTSYAKKREETEYPAFSLNFGFRAGFKNSEGFIFSTGLDYTQLNNKFEYLDSSSIKVITIIDTTYYPDGTFEVNKETTTTYGGDYKNTNTMRMIDIPLLISFEKNISDRSQFSFSTGAVLNLNLSYETRILSSSIGEVKWFNSGDAIENRVYKEGLGISFYFAAGYNYKLSSKWMLLIHPNIRYYPDSFTIGSYSLDENHILYGLKTGVRYTF